MVSCIHITGDINRHPRRPNPAAESATQRAANPTPKSTVRFPRLTSSRTPIRLSKSRLAANLRKARQLRRKAAGQADAPANRSLKSISAFFQPSTTISTPIPTNFGPHNQPRFAIFNPYLGRAIERSEHQASRAALARAVTRIRRTPPMIRAQAARGSFPPLIRAFSRFFDQPPRHQ